MGVESSEGLTNQCEGLQYRCEKRILEGYINNMKENTWNEIKQELSLIARDFSNYYNYIGFLRYVSKTYEDTPLLMSIHKNRQKETPLKSLLDEYWKNNQLCKFGSIDGETLSNMVLKAEWRDNFTSRKIRSSRESRRKKVSNSREIFSTNISKTDLLDQSTFDEKIIDATNAFFSPNQKNIVDNGVLTEGDNDFNYVESEDPVLQEILLDDGNVPTDFTVLLSLSGEGSVVQPVVEEQIVKLDDLKLSSSSDDILFTCSEKEKEVWLNDLDNYFNEIDRLYGETAVGKKLSERFLNMNLGRITTIINSGGTLDDIKNLFEKWNKEKLTLLPDGFFDESNLRVFSLGYQMLKYRDVKDKAEVRKRLVDSLHGEGFNEERGRLAHNIYQNYTLSEVVREVIMKCDYNNRNDVRKIQLLAGCFTNIDNLFSVDGDGIIGSQTLGFFNMLANSKSIQSLPDGDVYKEKVLGILKSKSKINFNTSIYENFDEPTSRLRNFKKDPRAYFASYGINIPSFQYYPGEDSGNLAVLNGVSSKESDFINLNRNSVIERSISELLEQGRDKTREQNAQIALNVLSLLPRDECQKIVEGFLGNDKVVSTFQSLTNLPKEMISKFLAEIFDGKKINDEYREAKGVLLLMFHQFSKGEIGGLINQVKGQVMDQAGRAVFEARKDFLEGTLGFSIMQLPQDKTRDDSINGYFYFRDQEHPESLYKYDAKKGSIYIIENISDSGNGVITFSSKGEEKHLFDIGKYDDLVGNLDVREILGLGGERAVSLEDLKQRIYVNTRNSIRVSKGTLDITTIRRNNEENVVKNGIIFKLGEIFNLKEKVNGNSNFQENGKVKDFVQFSKEDFGPVYDLISAALKSFSIMNSQELSDFNSLLEQILEVKNILDSDSYSGDGTEFNPLQKFIFENKKNIENLDGKKISDGNFGGQWYGEDIIYGSILKTLLDKNEGIFDPEKVFILNYSEGKMRNEIALQDMIRLNYSTLLSGSVRKVENPENSVLIEEALNKIEKEIDSSYLS